MLVGEHLEYGPATEAYCLLMAYIREDGKLGSKYNKEEIKVFCNFLAEILNHPSNFVGVDRTERERNEDGSLKLPPVTEHDGQGLA